MGAEHIGRGGILKMAEENNTQENLQNNQTAGGSNTTQTQNSSFDDILKNKEYQSEFDKRVQKALATAREKWDKETNNKITEAVEEAQKLAKMTAEQKSQHEREQAEKILKEREANITRRELQATAKDTLIDKGLPVELFETLNYSDAESCMQSIEAVEKSFKAAVEKAVENRIKKSAAPPRETGTTVNKDPFLEGLGL